MVLVTRNGTNIHTVLSLMSQENGLNPPFPNSAWHSGLLHGNRGWFRAKDWATRVTWVRAARSIFASRCGFLMCNRAKLWTPWGGGWLEQKLPKCEVTQWTQAGKNYEVTWLPHPSALSLPEPEPRSCLSSVACDAHQFMWRTKTRVKNRRNLNVDLKRG